MPLSESDNQKASNHALQRIEERSSDYAQSEKIDPSPSRSTEHNSAHQQMSQEEYPSGMDQDGQSSYDVLTQEEDKVIGETLKDIDKMPTKIITQLMEDFENKINSEDDSVQGSQQESQKYGYGKLSYQMSSIPEDISELNEQHRQEIFFNEIAQSLAQINEVKLRLTLLLDLYCSYDDSSSTLKEIEENIRKFNKVISLRESQMFMTLFILQNRSKMSFQDDYVKKFGELGSFAVPPEKIRGFINLKAAIQILTTERQILQQHQCSIEELKTSIQKLYRTKYLIRSLNFMKVINAKISTLSEVYPLACIMPKDDLFTAMEDSERWQKLNQQSITYRIYSDRESLKNSFNSFKQNVNIVNSMMGILEKSRKLPLSSPASWYNYARSSKYFLKIVLFKESAKKEAQHMTLAANAQLMKEVWNLPEHRVFRDLVQFVLPSIEHSERLFVPRVLKEYFNQNGQSPLPDMKIKFLTQYGNKLFQKQSYKDTIRIRINSPYELTPRYQIIDQNKKKHSQGNGILTHKVERLVNSALGLFKDQPKYVPEELIFHIHGGGFISMSSFIHQLYTRPWAKDLKIPIISVDYGKAPEHQYPEGLYDCLEAYMWTVKCFEQVYEANPKKIVIVGDSAGGNLAVALTSLLITWKLRVPDGLVLCYPVFNNNPKVYTRSLLGSLEDMILPHTLLKVCARSYINADSKTSLSDPLISPLFTPEYIIKQFPDMRIYVGTKDPFHDDCCRFTEKVNTIKPGIAYLTILEEFPHGFLQFDMKVHLHKYSRMANEEIAKALGKLCRS